VSIWNDSRVARCCSVLHCVALCFSLGRGVLQCVVMCCRVLHSVAVCCSVSWMTVASSFVVLNELLVHTRVVLCCTVLHCVAVL